MPEINRDTIAEKLKLFVSEDEAKAAIDKAVSDSRLERKSIYANEEMMKLLDALIAQGGFPEFVARNAKVNADFKE